MTERLAKQLPVQDPIEALTTSPNDGVLAVITGVDGPSYRPLGATMAIFPGGGHVGTLSSGCIESDIALHAEKTLASGTPLHLLYGRGSPFVDIRLPCGGGLEIMLIPRPDRRILGALSQKQSQRIPATLVIKGDGGLRLASSGETGTQDTEFLVRFLPDIKFYVFGKGPEASTFATLVQSSGYPNLLLSPDKETLEFGHHAGCDTLHLKGATWPEGLVPDEWSAIILFFHDHEWEPPILKSALETEAFYIGAQGSKRAREARFLQLELQEVSRDKLARLRGPIGLVPSARDARTLAVSVLAEVLATAAA